MPEARSKVHVPVEKGPDMTENVGDPMIATNLILSRSLDENAEVINDLYKYIENLKNAARHTEDLTVESRELAMRINQVRKLAEKAIAGYKVPGEFRTWDQYHEGRSSLADEILTLIGDAGKPKTQPQSRTWEDLTERLGRNDYPGILARHWQELPDDELPIALCEAWSLAEWPEQYISRSIWIDMFEKTGFVMNGKRASREELPRVLTLYRGATFQRRNGMSWTDSKEQAARFARRFNGMRKMDIGNLWQISVPRERVLARIDYRSESEYVLNIAEDSNNSFLLDLEEDGKS